MPAPADQYRVTNNLEEIDLDAIVSLLREHSYWANDRPRESIERSFRSPASIVFGLLDAGGRTVGCARVVTDGETIGWVCDVIIDPTHRGVGLGKRLVASVLAHPVLKDMRLILGTRDAHGLYERYGFERREMMRRPAPGAPGKPPAPH